MTKKLFFVTNVDWFFKSHRIPLAIHAIEQGYDVFLLTLDTGYKKELQNLGIHFIDIPFKRSGSNPFHELKCIFLLWYYYRKYKPDIIHHITLKAALLGSSSAKLAGNKHVVNAISGLGYNFTDGRNGILQRIIKYFIRLAFKSRDFSFILQNPDDVEMIQGLKLVPASHVFLIKGSGVDLNEYFFSEALNAYPLKVLFPARILHDKGVMEFINAAKILEKDFYGRVKFILAGDCDKENLAVLGEEELRKYLIPDYLEWIGYQKNMLSVYQNSDVIVLPSYREGLPKALIEACAIGRPIVTTDVPGCRECVKHGYNGYLVSVKTVNELADSIKELLLDADKRSEYGRNSRLIAEEEFSIERVIELTFRIYHEYINYKL